MYCNNSGSGHGYPDNCAAGEINPANPGPENYICYEPAMKKNGFCLMIYPLFRLDVCQESQGYFSLPAYKTNPGTE